MTYVSGQFRKREHCSASPVSPGISRQKTSLHTAHFLTEPYYQVFKDTSPRWTTGARNVARRSAADIGSGTARLSLASLCTEYNQVCPPQLFRATPKLLDSCVNRSALTLRVQVTLIYSFRAPVASPLNVLKIRLRTNRFLLSASRSGQFSYHLLVPNYHNAHSF